MGVGRCEDVTNVCVKVLDMLQLHVFRCILNHNKPTRETFM